jgi:hypothetical protein
MMHVALIVKISFGKPEEPILLIHSQTRRRDGLPEPGHSPNIYI